MEKPKFFFETDSSSEEYALSSQEHADTFFSTLKSSGIIHDSPDNLDEQQVTADAQMQRMEGPVLHIEYGTYQENYAIHLTPVHPQRNIRDDAMVRQVLLETVPILNDYVPQSLRVDIHPPRTDWKLKVISFVINGAAKSWALNTAQLEAEGIPRIYKKVEELIMAVR